MIQRRPILSFLSMATLMLTLCGPHQFVHAQNAGTFDEILSEITRGRPVSTGRVQIASDNIVKEEEPLLVTVDIYPIGDAKDEAVELHLLMSEGPWPRAYTAILRTHDGHAHFATRVRVQESCTLHVIADIDGVELFEATQDVKVSAGAYVR